MDIDATELRRWATDLSGKVDAVPAEARQVISKGALQIKRQLTSEMAASAHFKGAAQDIDYDMRGNASFSEAEIGPNSGPGNPGALANIAYFGTPRGGGTVPDPQGALDAEVPNVERYLGDILEGLI